MTYQVLLLDIDGVLSKHGEPIDPRVVSKLKDISRKIEVIPISGKNVSYLEGLFRGIGIIPKCIVGENGGCIYFPGKLEEYTYFHENPELATLVEKVKYRLMDVLSQTNMKVWFRENKVAITCLTDDTDALEKVTKNYIDLTHFKILKYSFAIQLIPKGLDKGWAASKLSSILNIPLKSFIAIGDDERDVPMFKKVGLSISIGDNEKAKKNSSLNFTDIKDALDYIASVL